MTNGKLSVPAPRHSIEVQRAHDRINSLEGLRGIAAIMVMVSHIAAITYNPVLGEKPANWLEVIGWELGAPAVDLFIVLSGYVVALSWMRSESYGVSSFYKRRLIRLMPTYWASYALAIFLWIACLGLASTPGMSETLILHASTLSVESLTANMFPLAVGYGQVVLNAPWWTLHIEIWGMVLTPFLVVMARNNMPRMIAVSVLAILTLEIVVGPLLKYNQSFVLLGGIAAGTLAAVTRDKWGIYLREGPYVFASMAALLIATAVLMRVMGFEQYGLPRETPRIFGMAGSLLIIMTMAAANPTKRENGNVRTKTARLLGQISYPLYVIHYPILITAATFAVSQGMSLRSAQWLAAGLSPLVLILAYLTYRWLDRHAIQASRRVFERKVEKLPYP